MTTSSLFLTYCRFHKATSSRVHQFCFVAKAKMKLRDQIKNWTPFHDECICLEAHYNTITYIKARRLKCYGVSLYDFPWDWTYSRDIQRNKKPKMSMNYWSESKLSKKHLIGKLIFKLQEELQEVSL
ncbi:hypothetical protein RO3G_10295 [Rhizopus delemar RA 99-880]|uniref:Uncharacterized protein n=1 Tax=Rhizopus delemar (strain RA 99-880 / ATCC MYA-4621 / FGSC 9543 / NRRL 43880) TaxID=246409 RepID=I1CAV5_RHIO9|nr:hypothetical protein RO3G_10295 [Rhizopus delemar RA 99-880]|eukprot:EIE85585.1 hypothetical protein RO3G_10295 [Rhizopus delemar RA 99-880]